MSLALLALAAGCGAPSPEPAPSPGPAAGEKGAPLRSASNEAAIGGSGDFALYAAVEAKTAPADNIVVSPFSIAQAFGLAHLGARGETARQIETSFGMPPGEAGDRNLAERRAALLRSEDGVRIRLANALWLSREWRFRPGFVEGARRLYGAEATMLDYRSAPADAAAAINGWARRETEGLIPEIVGLGDIDPDTAAFLTNALFFDGRWPEPFVEREVRPFLRGDGSDVPFTFMKRIGSYAAVEQDGWRAIRLPYGASGRFALDVMMPARRSAEIPRMTQTLSEALAARLAAAERRQLRLFLPKFEIQFRKDLIETLQTTGLTLPFDRQRADFSGMAEPGQQRLFIDRVFHAAKLQVFEEGTKAAAVTALRVMPVSAPPLWRGPDFPVDRPFLFAIRDTRNDSLLFMGRVSAPQPFEEAPAR